MHAWCWTVSFLAFAMLAPGMAQAQRTAALMPEVHRPAGVTEAQVEDVRRAARRALRGASYRVLARREVASRLTAGMRCRPPEPCLEPAHDALGVDVVVHLTITGSPSAVRVQVQLTDGTTRVQHGLSDTTERVPQRVHDTLLRAVRRLQLAER